REPGRGGAGLVFQGPPEQSVGHEGRSAPGLLEIQRIGGELGRFPRPRLELADRGAGQRGLDEPTLPGQIVLGQAAEPGTGEVDARAVEEVREYDAFVVVQVGAVDRGEKEW